MHLLLIPSYKSIILSFLNYSFETIQDVKTPEKMAFVVKDGNMPMKIILTLKELNSQELININLLMLYLTRSSL